MKTKQSIPREIADAFYSGGVVDCSVLLGGEINVTLLVTDTDGRKTVLQKLSHATNDAMAKDYDAIAAYLHDQGWPMASALKAGNGAAYVADHSGKFWRSFEYIEAEPGADLEGDLQAGVALGGLLGKLHYTLACFEYEPHSAKPDFQDHFQDTVYYADRLEVLMPKIADPANRKLARELIKRARENPIDDVPPQLIHGDPRVANTLCKEGKPFMFIDWDTLMIANPLIDLGDLLQSITKEIMSKTGEVTADNLRPVIEAYYTEAKPNTDERSFMQSALGAGKVIALNGGMRHLIDSVEDYYFGWDADRFKTRREFNEHAARRRWHAYMALDA